MRLFIGNLFNEASKDDLDRLFKEFGGAQKVDIKAKKDIEGNVLTTFAFVDLTDEGHPASQVIQKLNNLKWKGKTLRVQMAQESFVDRLARERREKMSQICAKPDSQEYDPMKLAKTNLGSNSQSTTPSTSKDNLPQELPLKRPLQRKQYCSSSDDDEDESENQGSLKSKNVNVMARLSNFDSNFWNDEVDQRSDGRRKTLESNKKSLEAQSNSNKKRLEALKRKKSDSYNSGGSIMKENSSNKQLKFEKVEEKRRENLFNDDESEPDDEGDDKFEVRKEFEGKSGAKLMQLQSKFQSDARFKLTQAFKDESDGDDESDAEDEGHEVEGGDDFAAEKRRNLDILQQVLGDKKVEKPKRNKKDAEFKSLERFDPESYFDPKKKEVQKAAREDCGINKRVESQVPLVSDEKSYEVKSDLFSTGQSLFKFGFAKQEEKVINNEKYKSEDISSKKKKLDFLDKNPFKYDSSESEEEEEAEAAADESKTSDFSRKLAQRAQQKSTNNETLNTFFFVNESDPRFDEGKNFLLNAAMSLDEIREKYEEERPKLAAILKKKMRNKAKKAENATKKNKRQFRKKSWNRKKK